MRAESGTAKFKSCYGVSRWEWPVAAVRPLGRARAKVWSLYPHRSVRA